MKKKSLAKKIVYIGLVICMILNTLCGISVFAENETTDMVVYPNNELEDVILTEDMTKPALEEWELEEIIEENDSFSELDINERLQIVDEYRVNIRKRRGDGSAVL